MFLLAAIEVFDMLEAENGDSPHLATWRAMTNHYHTFYISVKCHFSTTSRERRYFGLEGDINLFRYVRNNPINRIDPRGLAVYFCFGVYDTYWHSVVCVNEYCAGLMPGERWYDKIWGPGSVEKAPFKKEYCKEIKLDNGECCSQGKFERCVKDTIDRGILGEKYHYGLLFYNCSSWAKDVISHCMEQACKK